MAELHKKNIFTHFAQMVANASGHPGAFLTAAGIVIVWGISGPIFNYSDTWQLVINTGTTIVTFLMVFLIQNSQNRDTFAIQIKLDELIRATKEAHNALLDIEELDDKTLRHLRDYYEDLAKASRNENKPKVKNEDLPVDFAGGKKKKRRKRSS